MDKLLFAVLAFILIFITVNNITLISRYKQNKTYISSYQDVLHNKENSYENIKKFIEKEKTAEFKNKGRVIELYSELCNDLEYDETLKDIDFKEIFCVKGKYKNSQVNLNSDTFVFVILAMAKAKELKKKGIIDTLINKLNEVEKLQGRLEYQEIVAFGKALTGSDDKGTEFMKGVLDGNYTEYAYEKNMIGLYKRIAATTLAYNKEEFDEYFKNDLYHFSKPIIGECILKSLGLYEKYKPAEEESKN